MKKTYTCYEMNKTMTKEEWLQYYDENGDKSNFASREDWFYEMIKMNILA